MPPIEYLWAVIISTLDNAIGVYFEALEAKNKDRLEFALETIDEYTRKIKNLFRKNKSQEELERKIKLFKKMKEGDEYADPLEFLDFDDEKKEVIINWDRNLELEAEILKEKKKVIDIEPEYPKLEGGKK